MNTLDLLTTRHSEKKLTTPAPNSQQLEQLLQAAMHVPDHGKLMPYRFVVIQDNGLTKFEQLLKQAVVELKLDEKHQQKAEKLAQQSPMIIAVIAKIDPNIAKVPEWEQLITAGCAAYAIQLAANSMGFDNVWITGKWTQSECIRQALGCGKADQLVAFLRIGTVAEKNLRESKQFDSHSFTTYF